MEANKPIKAHTVPELCGALYLQHAKDSGYFEVFLHGIGGGGGGGGVRTGTKT